MNRAFAIGIGVAAALAVGLGPVRAAERTYYIAAEEVEWDYAPAGRDRMMGTPFTDDQKVFVERSAHAIGRVYRKAVFRAYADATFTGRAARPPEWAHLGILGPVLHAEVGDVIRVVFRNNASRPYSMHPHGVFYTKAHEGVPYADGTSGADKADDAVAPGATHTYVWRVPARAGPAASDPSSIAWLYHSHVDEPADTNSGLVGAIVVTAKGKARAGGRPRDVDREFVTLFSVMDENVSWYLDHNIEAYADATAVEADSDDFIESNLMHGINGRLFANLPGLEMRLGERVRWYVLALGTEVDLHTPHWHGNTGVAGRRRVDTVNLMPATSITVDMVPDSPGVWMYHCHVNDHLIAGMTALYTVAE